MRYSRFILSFLFCLILSACSRPADNGHFSAFSESDSSKLSGYLVRSNSNSDMTEGIAFAQMLRDFAHAERNVDDEIQALHVLFELHFNHGHNDMALNVAQRAIDLSDSTSNEFLRARSLHFMGKYLVRQRNATLASRNLSTSFRIFMSIGDTLNVSAVFRDFVRSYNQNFMYDSADISIARCFRFDSILGNTSGYAEDLALNGYKFLSLFNSDLTSPKLDALDSAKRFFGMAHQLNAALETPNLNVDEVNVVGYTELYYLLSKYKNLSADINKNYLDSAWYYHGLASRYVRISGDGFLRKKFDVLGLEILMRLNNYFDIQNFADSLVAIGERPGAGYLDMEIAYRVKSLMSERAGDFVSALRFREKADKYEDAYDAHNSSLAITVGIARGQHEGEAARNKARQMQMEGEAKAMIARLISMSVIMILLVVLGVLVFRSYRRQKHYNAHINEINEELVAANDEITSRNAEITESISYASIIQQAAMPATTEIFDIFGENLVLLKPRDIVSGDFYWASETGPYKLLVAGDCTGHGVPGALLSMLGMSILDYVTRHFGMNNISAGLVLDRMRNYFKRTLNQGTFRTDMALDSIDLALIVVDTQTKQLYYAAAFRPLIYFRHGELIKLKADPMPIGVYPKEREHFTNHVIDLEEGDVFYMFSDGIPDQSGYENGEVTMAKAFSNKRLLNLLTDIHKLPFGEQKQKIEQALMDWRSPKSETQEMCAQTDDNVIVGISVNNFIKF